MRKTVLALMAALIASPSWSDTLIQNINGIQVGTDGKIEQFDALLIGDDGRVINMEGLRYPDEFVRHKMLDAMGDLALAGARFIGCFRSHRGGHRLNANALRRLLDDRSAFEVVETQRRDRGHSAEMVTVAGPRAALWMG